MESRVTRSSGWVFSSLLVATLVGASVLGGGCGSDGSAFDPDAGELVAGDGSIGDPQFGDAGDNPLAGPLEVRPANPTITVAGGAVATQAFQAFPVGGSTAVAANWSVDDVRLGTIDASGLFTASGKAGGTTRVEATTGAGGKGETTITVNLSIVENPGNVSPADQAALRAGGAADGGFRWLYPYDKTVFPRGLSGPTMQFGGEAPSMTRVHIKSAHFEYEGFFGASNPGRVQLPAAIWSAVETSAGGTDTVAVDVTKRSAAGITGPVSETWTIATGKLTGRVYYNTYNSPAASNNGAVMRVKPGQNFEVLLGSPNGNGCVVCHSVSANGNVLVAGVNWGSGNPIDSKAWNLSETGATVRNSDAEGRKLSFGALTPDGTLMIGNGVPAGDPNLRGLSTAYASRLIDTATGAVIPTPSWDNAVTTALTPVFSPDGKRIAFNRRDNGDGRTLSTMLFDIKTKSFSALENLVTHPGAGVAAWPAFLPDGDNVLYHLGNKYDTEKGSFADLEVVNVTSKARHALDALNGKLPGGAYYLPFGETEEGHMNYEPTVLPVAVGGYYWVIFTSRRSYGNTIGDTGTVVADDPFVENSPRKKLWVAAIDINAPAGQDPSHPAFYLPGQELLAGNMRGFWALDPCKQNGQSCESGDECCGGFCRQVQGADGGVAFSCVPKPQGCAKELETCTTAADCCDPGALCLNGRCARPTPK